MIDNKKISNEEPVDIIIKLIAILGEIRPIDNPIIAITRMHEKIIQARPIQKKQFKIGKWNDK